MAKFNLNQLLGGGKAEDGEGRGGSQDYKITHIPVHKLEPSQDNFYCTEQIEELKASIAAFGIKQNLIVKPIEGGKYRVIAGHRRRLAILSLVEEGKREFEKVPCIIESEEDELREKLLLITTNSTARQLTDWEKIKQAEEMRAILEQIKKRDKIPGRLRELIASTLDISPTQVARMESISKNLAPEFKAELQEGKVNMSTAYELSGLPAEQQQEVYEEYRDKGNVSIKDAKQRKREKPSNDRTSEAGLKACPFCGNSPRAVKESGGYRISCEGCSAATALAADKDTAYERWNRRHQD
ncbi:restriction alleviation protein, Lar family [Paenibacillus thiaminolyticus]|uniref:Lar family restriction alleviation protein n=1 Tax=Paenibacillus thiaminolyticus TaxID=49283 RepID=UPI001161D783|nr:Lar family restriction alleviation protein [Paenibacillus thiaminolyticus]NGP58799.1 restriction alleviation protein, Lar family [Paenibacillus thiaminolyticus]NGP59906.1 restriction alleviation protein, Lar family [Paenibacillus thiaminolyticus]